MPPKLTFDFEHRQKLDPITQLKVDIAQEGLRQAQESFNLSKQSFKLVFMMTAASGLISLGGVGLLLTERVSEGTATTAGGIASGLCFSQMAKDAKDRLDAANLRLDTIRTEVAFIQTTQQIEQHNIEAADIQNIGTTEYKLAEANSFSDLH
ncbi:hypothetical protein [Halomicronema sp. CCY15110]|uniref:TRADD-N-associated membrane domain-containing protein n=1 Tax=Halomicronema sp. CCY15110 TaxID=2767773 RepID=UPI001951C452|nr:hypothetical protein [Halomicronema sp. CCY15110]